MKKRNWLSCLISSFIGVFILWLMVLRHFGLKNMADSIVGLLIYYLPILFAATLISNFIFSNVEVFEKIKNYFLSKKFIASFLIIIGLSVIIPVGNFIYNDIFFVWLFFLSYCISMIVLFHLFKKT